MTKQTFTPTRSRTWIFSCVDDAERDDWVRALALQRQVFAGSARISRRPLMLEQRGVKFPRVLAAAALRAVFHVTSFCVASKSATHTKADAHFMQTVKPNYYRASWLGIRCVNAAFSNCWVRSRRVNGSWSHHFRAARSTRASLSHACIHVHAFIYAILA
jgi:hypothetical protein